MEDKDERIRTFMTLLHEVLPRDSFRGVVVHDGGCIEVYGTGPIVSSLRILYTGREVYWESKLPMG
jgi:hypothetical protein